MKEGKSDRKFLTKFISNELTIQYLLVGEVLIRKVPFTDGKRNRPRVGKHWQF